MQTSYSDIKRYNLNPLFLLQAARKVIHDLGWDIQQETESKINAVIPIDSSSFTSKISVIIHPGYVALDCECDSDIAFHNYYENQTRAKQFIQGMDNHLEAISPAQLNSYKETLGRSLWLGKTINQKESMQ